MSKEDVLEIIANEDIIKLSDIYKNDFPRAIYIYNFLISTLKWKMQYPKENYVTLMAPHGNWQNGSFIALHQENVNAELKELVALLPLFMWVYVLVPDFLDNCTAFDCYEIYIFTLENNYEILYEAIVNTKKVDWTKRILVYAVHIDHYPIVLKALSRTYFALQHEIPCSIWWMPMKKALNFEINCPPEVYVAKLRTNDAFIINSHWPHKYPGSKDYLAFIIERNGGYGIYLKSSDDLIAWILRIQIGMGTLHVVDNHKRKGYGSLVTKALARALAQEGINPVASILNNNGISQAMFTKIGFVKCASVMYLESNELAI